MDHQFKVERNRPTAPSPREVFARLVIGSILALVSFPSWAQAQRIRFAQQSTPVPSLGYQPPLPTFAPSNAPYNPPNLNAPVYPSGSSPFASGPLVPLGNPSGLSAPAFDPYATAPSSGVLPSSSGWPTLGGWNNQPITPTIYPNNYPASVYPNQTPPALFPGTSWGNSGWSGANSNNWGFNNGANAGWNGSVFPSNNGNGGLFGGPWFSSGNGSWNGNSPFGNGWFNNGNPNGPLFNSGTPQPLRFFLGPRLRHSWVEAGDSPTSLETNDTDVSLVFAIPNILGSTQPLYIVPSFSFHTFEGPRAAQSDIPANAYSAFLDVGWESDPVRTFGAELGVRTGVFTDFDTFTSDSFRVMGKGLGRVRLTPNATLRAGVYYIDRNRYKLVPAGGILWIPNPDTRFDIFFPEPKLAHYLNTLGTTDVWWYVTGYYGGGTWTVKRASGEKDSIDINEMRIALGLEFGRNDLIRQGRRLGFFEVGYGFNRELLFKARPMDNTDLKEGLVLRAGVGY